jgi:hypothetical protein
LPLSKLHRAERSARAAPDDACLLRERALRARPSRRASVIRASSSTPIHHCSLASGW